MAFVCLNSKLSILFLSAIATFHRYPRVVNIMQFGKLVLLGSAIFFKVKVRRALTWWWKEEEEIKSFAYKSIKKVHTLLFYSSS